MPDVPTIIEALVVLGIFVAVFLGQLYVSRHDSCAKAVANSRRRRTALSDQGNNQLQETVVEKGNGGAMTD